MNMAMIRRRQLMNMVKVEEAEGNPVVFNTNTVRGLAGLRLFGASEQPSPSIAYPQDWTNAAQESGQIQIDVLGGNLYSGGDIVAESITSSTGYHPSPVLFKIFIFL